MLSPQLIRHFLLTFRNARAHERDMMQKEADDLIQIAEQMADKQRLKWLTENLGRFNTPNESELIPFLLKLGQKHNTVQENDQLINKIFQYLSNKANMVRFLFSFQHRCSLLFTSGSQKEIYINYAFYNWNLNKQ